MRYGGKQRGRGARESVIAGEVARRGARLAESVGDPAYGGLGDVFVERARWRARGDDALDRSVIEGAEGGGVAEGGVEISGGEALAQEEDLASLVAP